MSKFIHKGVLYRRLLSLLLVVPILPATAGKHFSESAIIHSWQSNAHQVSSGVPVSPCHVLSNEHAVRNSSKAAIEFEDRYYNDVRIIATDPINDLSLIYIKDCPIQNFVTVSTTRPKHGEQLISIYQQPIASRNRVVSSSGEFHGYKYVTTEENKHISSMVIGDSKPREGSSGGGVFSRHGLVSVIFGFKAGYVGETYAVDYNALRNFLDLQGIIREPHNRGQRI